MFGLPTFTVFVMVAVPVFWILYTIGFLIISRNWSKDDDDAHLPSGRGVDDLPAEPGRDARPGADGTGE